MVKRRLTTIFAADVDGYSRLMGEDEHATLERLKEYRETISAFVERHHGRVVSWSGDGLLAEFVSVVEAVQCAVEIQGELKARNDRVNEAKRMNFRIGINLGDVMVEGHDIFGEGVNIAARLQTLAPPGGILISGPVYEQVKSKLSVGFSFLGQRQVKNISGQVSVYGVQLAGAEAATVPLQPENAIVPSTEKVIGIRTGGILRRGLALAIDYAIVAAIALPIAIFFENTWNDSIEIELPFIELGTDRVLQQGEPRVIEQKMLDAEELEELKKLGLNIKVPKVAQVVVVDAVVERDIFGLVKHTYKGQNIQKVVLGARKFESDKLRFRDLQLVDEATHQPIDRIPLSVFVLAFMVIYFGLTESSSLQGSIGKRMLGLKVRNAQEPKDLTFFQALGRALVKVISVVPLFWIAFLNRHRRCVHDMLADSVVVQER